ncbi:MAG TPA: hypothetical protein VHA74_00965 [Candidatus Dojkabacteria bacterium]|nr:hypothetical protein [Candidatus Dojkabacteria bacterium]
MKYHQNKGAILIGIVVVLAFVSFGLFYVLKLKNVSEQESNAALVYPLDRSLTSCPFIVKASNKTGVSKFVNLFGNAGFVSDTAKGVTFSQNFSKVGKNVWTKINLQTLAETKTSNGFNYVFEGLFVTPGSEKVSTRLSIGYYSTAVTSKWIYARLESRYDTTLKKVVNEIIFETYDVASKKYSVVNRVALGSPEIAMLSIKKTSTDIVFKYKKTSSSALDQYVFKNEGKKASDQAYLDFDNYTFGANMALISQGGFKTLTLISCE